MRYLATLGACLALSGTLAVGYVAFPRTEPEVVVELPARPSLATLKAALGTIETNDTSVTMVDGQPFRCVRTSGTRWCWRTTRADAKAARQISLEG